VATGEVFDESGQQNLVGGAESPERRGSPGQCAPPAHDVRGVARGRERALGLGPEQPTGVGQLQAAAGAHEERDVELGFEVGDLFRDARAREVQDVRGGGEGAVLGRGEEVRELLQPHALAIAVGVAYGKRSQSALARGRRASDTRRMTWGHYCLIGAGAAGLGALQVLRDEGFPSIALSAATALAGTGTTTTSACT
jgi:hypothetical protein